METTIKIRNKSNYLRGFDRVFNNVSNPASAMFKQNKRKGYELRLYYEYQQTISKGGFVAFLTLTYNDLHCPKFEDMPCFDVEDLRFMTHGRFSRLISAAGYEMKYFVSCELGDGKGRRAGFNPHYHMLLFLVPNRPDARLTPSQVLHLAKVEWQGFDEKQKFRKYQFADHGIVRAGKFGVKVNGFRAINYCSKYVTKSEGMANLEQQVYFNLWQDLKPSFDEYVDFCTSFGVDHCSSWSLDVDSGCLYDTGDIADPLLFEDFDSWVHGESFEAEFFYKYWYSCNKEIVDHKLRLWRNRYSDKVRISNGVGASGVDAAVIVNGKAKIALPDKFGFKLFSLPLYMYRQKYCEVTKDRNGNNRYVLNKEGIEYKLGLYDSQIRKSQDMARYALCVYLSCPDSFKSIVLPSDVEDGIRKYAEYNVVYKYRRFRTDEISYCSLDPRSDFERFLYPAGDSDWNEYHPVFNNHLYESGFQFYDSHPYFSNYTEFFSCIDGVLDKLASKNDDDHQEAFDETERVKKNLNDVIYGNYRTVKEIVSSRYDENQLQS